MTKGPKQAATEQANELAVLRDAIAEANRNIASQWLYSAWKDRAEKAEAALARLPTEFQCKARASATPEPQDCGWPTCGCDPYADKVLAAIDESGFEIVSKWTPR